MKQTLSNEQKLILSALSNALFHRKIIVPERIDWQEVLSESKAQSVYPLVFHSINSAIPDDLLPNFKREYLKQMSNTIKVNYTHRIVGEIFYQRGIPYVFLKGIVSAMYYPQPDLRAMGDVDILVSEEYLEQAEQALLSTGMVRIDDDTHQFHRVYKLSQVTCELHWDLPGMPTKNNTELRRYLSGTIENSRFGVKEYTMCRVPSEFDHGLILLMHSAAHLTSSGIGLRHLCDWAVFYQNCSKEIHSDQYREMLESVGLWKYSSVLNGMIEYCFLTDETVQNTQPDQSLISDLVRDVFYSGNFGIKRKQLSRATLIIRDPETRTVQNRNALICLLLYAKNKIIKYNADYSPTDVHRPSMTMQYYFSRIKDDFISVQKISPLIGSVILGIKRRNTLKKLGIYETNSEQKVLYRIEKTK